MDIQLVAQLAQELHEAEKKRKERKRITADFPDISSALAYEIMEERVRLKQAEGQKPIGYKLGYTSLAMQKQMGITEPMYGVLFDYMPMKSGDSLELNQLIHPKLEPEIAFVFKKDLQGFQITRADVLEAVDYLCPALEIVDSRYLHYQFQLADIIADNNSAAKFVVSDRSYTVDQIDLPALEVQLKQNGGIVEHGKGSDVFGNPVDALVWLVQTLSLHNRKIKAGEIVLSGGITKAITLHKHDHIEGEFGPLGVVELHVK